MRCPRARAPLFVVGESRYGVHIDAGGAAWIPTAGAFRVSVGELPTDRTNAWAHPAVEPLVDIVFGVGELDAIANTRGAEHEVEARSHLSNPGHT